MALSGFDKLSRTLKDAQKAIDGMGEEIGSVSFNPYDPVSIEAAMQQVETLINEKLGAYSSNPNIAPLMEGLRDRYKQAVLDRAAELRLEGDKENG